MISISFSTLACPDWSWHTLLERGPQYGYDGVEIRLLARNTELLAVPEFSAGELPARRRELAEAGFRVCGLGSSVRFDYSESSDRDEQLRIGRRYLDLARELDAGFVRVFGDVVPKEGAERQTVVGNIADGLQRLGEYGKTAGVDVLIETHGDFADSRLMNRTLGQVESAAVGVLWDTHHPWRFRQEPPADTFAALEPWIRHTHWKDSISRAQRPVEGDRQSAAEEAHGLMSGHRHADYVLFGEGEFPALDCMRLLSNSGYDGWMCYEWEKMWHPELDDPEVALPPFPERIRRLWQTAAKNGVGG